MTEKKKAKTKRPRVNMIVRKVADCETGEVFKALVAMHDTDRRAMQERRLKIGDLVACEIRPPRDVVQWRKAHALAQYLILHVERFTDMQSHEVIKVLQREGNNGQGIECETITIDLGPLGKVAAVQPKSLSFESMGQDVFANVYAAMCNHVGQNYLGGITDQLAVEDMIKMMPQVRLDG